MKVFIDLDGVLCDFDGYIDRFNLRMPNGSILFHNLAKQHPEFFLHLEKLPDADHLVESVLSLCAVHNIEVGILTAIPLYTTMLQAEEHKRDWVARHYPHLAHVVDIGPFAIDKQNHCKPGDVLIDDNPRNIAQWHKRGGFGILHSKAKTSISALNEYLKIDTSSSSKSNH